MDAITERKEVIAYCLTYPNVYEDHPFHDANWCVMRHRGNRRVFAWIFEKDGHIWVNLKCAPEWTHFWRSAYASVQPAYHLNKTHWNSVILDGSVPKREIEIMISESYALTAPRTSKSKRGSE